LRSVITDIQNFDPSDSPTHKPSIEPTPSH
jgi:hypothetical protein